MPVRSLATILFSCALITTSAACGSEKADSNAVPGAVEVVVTTPQLADFTRQIGGDAVEVTELIPAGTDPHDYEPTPRDIEAIRTADVIAKNGVGLESWFDSTIQAADPEGTIVDASTGVALLSAGDEKTHEHAEGSVEHEHGADDPHIWQSPKNAQVMANNIAVALQASSPEFADRFRQGNEQYQSALAALDTEIEQMLAPLDDKRIFTDHDSLGYFIEHYKLENVGSVLRSFSSQADLSAQSLQATVDTVRASGVKAIFVGRAIDPKIADTVARDAQVQVISGDDALYTDTLADSGIESTYVGAMRHNARVISSALAA